MRRREYIWIIVRLPTSSVYVAWLRDCLLSPQTLWPSFRLLGLSICGPVGLMLFKKRQFSKELAPSLRDFCFGVVDLVGQSCRKVGRPWSSRRPERYNVGTQ
jgi:hypothetical protein